MLDGASASIRETRSEQLVVADGRWERVLRTGAALNNAARTTTRPWTINLRHKSLTCDRDAAMAWCRGASTSKGLARMASLNATDTRAHPRCSPWCECCVRGKGTAAPASRSVPLAKGRGNPSDVRSIWLLQKLERIWLSGVRVWPEPLHRSTATRI